MLFLSLYISPSSSLKYASKRKTLAESSKVGCAFEYILLYKIGIKTNTELFVELGILKVICKVYICLTNGYTW